MKTAIFNLSIGYKPEWEICQTSQREYCKKHNIDYIQLTESKVHFINCYFEKFECLQLLEEYDRVLCIDSDILINPNAENIFERYPDTDTLYAFHENVGGLDMNRDPWIETYSPKFKWPMFNDRKQYFNTGCILYSKIHSNLFNLIKGIKFTPKHFSIDGGEQTAINYIVTQNDWKFKSLDYSFNRMDLGAEDPNEDRLKANFIHYAGPCKYLSKGETKHTLITNDWEKLK
tara:strand:+ start:149 stop:841 length:693 start_codon:yes stop_codon:yes gene_type:complete